MARDGKTKTGKRARKAGRSQVPAELVPAAQAPVIRTRRGSFDLDDPVLPGWVERSALGSGGYPYDTTMARADYDATLASLQVELVKLQQHVDGSGMRIVALFEGRDAAGKGGNIFAIRQYMNPRTARIVALTRPSERERGQWYFQRYIEHLPTAGEIVLFDRSWYNRGGVEPVMGFCTAAECRQFLIQAPVFESMLVEAGIVLFKVWLDIGREMQLKQFHQRRHDPLKIWKLSPVDYTAMERFEAYTTARDTMMAATHTKKTPWTVVLANDKRRARLAVIRRILSAIDYPGKDSRLVGRPDAAILGGPALLDRRRT
jgi:polyphosphate kinase 2